jgi:hypothetical protein
MVIRLAPFLFTDVQGATVYACWRCAEILMDRGFKAMKVEARRSCDGCTSIEKLRKEVSCKSH